MVHNTDNAKNSPCKMHGGLPVQLQQLIVNNSLTMWHRGKYSMVAERKMLRSVRNEEYLKEQITWAKHLCQGSSHSK